MTTGMRRYQWFALGDINGFFGLMFDNITVLSFLAGVLVLGFGFPADIVYTRMFPGTAFGVLIGDLLYELKVLAPTDMTDDEKRLMEQLAERRKARGVPDPRAELMREP